MSYQQINNTVSLEWTAALDEHYAVDVIYLDFKKAFDSVPHQELLTKIKSYGIEGNIFKWLSSFLHNRLQRVVLNGVSSQWARVKVVYHRVQF